MASLKLAAGSAAAALLAACGGGSSATNTPAGPKATALQGGTGGQTPVVSGGLDRRRTRCDERARSDNRVEQRSRRGNRGNQGRRLRAERLSRRRYLAGQYAKPDTEGERACLAVDL